MQTEDLDSSDTNPEETPPSQQLMMLSCAATNATKVHEDQGVYLGEGPIISH